MNKPKFDPNKPFDVVDSKPKFDPSQPFEPLDDVSKIETALRGYTQGVSLDFQDELGGAMSAAGRLFGLENIGGNVRDWGIADDGPTLNPEKLKEAYIQTRDAEREANKAAQESNPSTYLASNVGGALTSSMMPGMGVFNAAKGASTLSKVGLAAAQGGLSGAGMSEAEDLTGLAKDTTTSAALNAGFAGVGEKVLSPLASKLGNSLKNVGGYADTATDWTLKKTGKVLANIDEADTTRYLNNRDAINNSMDIGDLGEKLIQGSDNTNSLISKMFEKSSRLSNEAWETLKPNQTISKKSIQDSILKVQNDLLTDGQLIGKNQARVYADLTTLSKQLGGLQDNIPEPIMKRVIQALDKNIDWDNQKESLANDAFSKIRTSIDETLKKQNPAYKNAMAATEEVTKSINTVKKAFENRQNPDDFNKFIRGVKNLGNKDPQNLANKALDSIKKHTGEDLKEQILNSQAKSSFSKDTTNGSRKTLAGAALGKLAGAFVGGTPGYVIGEAAGGIAGSSADKYAGKVMKGLLDGKITAAEYATKFNGTKYANILKDAASRGNKSLAATHFLLSQKDSEYRKMTQGDDEE